MFIDFFDVDHFLSFIEFVTILLLFYVMGFFGHKTCEILAPWARMEPSPPALEATVLTTGPPGKSQKGGFKFLLLPAQFYGENNQNNRQLVVNKTTDFWRKSILPPLFF